MYQKTNQKRNEKRKKRKQEEEEEEEEIRRGLSNKRYVSSCIIEDTSLTFY